MRKFPPVPKILRKVPLHLSDMTDAQWDASVKWYSKLPLQEIRKRQEITAGQKEDLYRSTRAIGRDMTTHELMGWHNLDIMESILTEAAMRKLPRYRSNPENNKFWNDDVNMRSWQVTGNTNVLEQELGIELYAQPRYALAGKISSNKMIKNIQAVYDLQD